MPARGGSRRSPRTRSAVRRRRLQPVGEPLVELRAQLLRHCRVGGVADEDVGEAEAVVAGKGERSGRELLARRAQRRLARASARAVLGQELGDRSQVEHPPLDRGALEDRALVAESRSMRAASSAWIVGGTSSSPLVAVLRLAGRAAARGRAGCPRRPRRSGSQRLGDARAERACDSVSDSVSDSGSSRSGVAARPRRPQDGRSSSRSGRARQTSRIGAWREAADVLDEVEQGRLGPVHVVDDDDERPLARERLEEPADRPEGLLRPRVRGLGEAHRAGDPLRDQLGAVVVADELGDRGLRSSSGDLLDDLRERPVGDPLAVGEAPADDDTRARRRSPRRSSRTSRDLPIPGGAEDGDEPARLLARRASLERLHERGELALAADERGVQPAREGRHVGKDLEQAPGGDRLRPCP